MAWKQKGGSGSGYSADTEHGEPPPTDEFGCDVYAASLSAFDIAAAINSLGATGGIVCLPAGTGTWVNTGVEVSVPYIINPITIHGEGIGVTNIVETAINSTLFQHLYNGAFGATPAGALRFTGISFKGAVQTVAGVDTGDTALDIRCSKDWRVDNCSFEDFASIGIYTACSTGSYIINGRGLVDHCSFDNPYKDNWKPHQPAAPYWALWGYGIVVVGSSSTAAWDPDIDHYLGDYYPTTTFNGYDIPAPIYVEDCTFTRCRHAIASNGGGYFVSRHNTFSKASPYGQNDVHGGSPGGRGMECYDNIFDLSDESYTLGQDAAEEPRGGSGIITDEFMTKDLLYTTKSIWMQDDGEPAPYNINHLYSWNNTAKDTLGNWINWDTYIDDDGYTVDVDYFLRAPTVPLDGFTFTKYTYPHPLI